MNTDAPRYSNLRDYLRVLREQRLVIVLCAIAFALAALVISSRQDEVYQAQASINFQDENADLGELGAATPIARLPAERAAIAAQTITEPKMAELAANRLGGKIRPTVLRRQITAQPEARTNLVIVTARWGNPEGAANVANAFADAAREDVIERARRRLRSRVRSLREDLRDLPSIRTGGDLARSLTYDRIARLENLSRTTRPAEIVIRAEANDAPVSPKPVRTTILGGVLGLTLGILAAFLRDSLDRRFRNAKEIREELALPLIGHVRDDVLGRSVTSSNGRKQLSDAELEAFRILRTNVGFLDVDRPVKSVAVTSALPEEGKSTVAQALACAFAAGGKRVMLVECDLRRPTLAKRLGLQETPGLTDYLAGHASPQDVVQTVNIPPASVARPNGGAEAAEGTTFACITAGSRSPQPAELLGSERCRSFLEQIREAYDAVVLDTSPLLLVVDTLELVSNVDGLLLCVRASQTTRDQARAAKAALHHVRDRPAGVVITGVRSGDEGDYGYYSYSYAYGGKA